MFDIVDGGIPATFIDGPKQGHVGVVNPTDGMPPPSLTFQEDLVYERTGKTKVRAIDGMTNQPVTYQGVGYRMAKRCGFAIRLNYELRQVAEERTAQQIERGEVTP